VSDDLKVYTKKETQKLLGLSGRTWDRLEALGDTPPKTRLSPNRIGYRSPDIAAWLDARRVASTARELIDSNWKRVGAAAAAVVEKVACR
jgi:predicted DNA-binding transcriptional regulator AlpA